MKSRFLCLVPGGQRHQSFLGVAVYRRLSSYGSLVVCRVVRVECGEVPGNMATCMGLN